MVTVISCVTNFKFTINSILPPWNWDLPLDTINMSVVLTVLWVWHSYRTYWHLFAAIGNTCRYFGVVAFRCLWCICLFCLRKMSGSFQNREVVNIPQFLPELHLFRVQFWFVNIFPSIWTLPHFLMNVIVPTMFFSPALWPWNITRYLRGQRNPPSSFYGFVLSKCLSTASERLIFKTFFSSGTKRSWVGRAACQHYNTVLKSFHPQNFISSVH